MTAPQAPLATLVAALYYLVLAVLAFYGAHRLAMVAIFLAHRRGASSTPAPPKVWPRVTVQLPIYNERYVAGRLIDAVARLDYPRDRLEVQVLDDSTDDTSELVAERVAFWRARGLDLQHVRRGTRDGFKAGALAEGLTRASGELLAVFDADFVPAPDFLARVVPQFVDPGVGVVQARWEHLNRDSSLLTRAQAILLDGHFVIEQAARAAAGCFFNFNGTAGIWRRQAIVEAGGWSQDTLTEDLDLSYRAQLAGWRFRFLSEVTVPAELPVDVHAFKRQQFRWAKGSIQTARKLLRRLLAAPLPWRVKLEATIHLTNNASYPLMVLLALLLFPAMWLRREVAPGRWLAFDVPMFLGATAAVVVFYLASQAIAVGDWRRTLRVLPAVLGLGIGLAVNNARAVLEGLFQDGGVFERTPKYRIEGGASDWRGKSYRARRGTTTWSETALAAYLAASTAAAVRLGMWWALPFLYLFLQGSVYIVWLSAFGGRPWATWWRWPADVSPADG
jgi:cellulose synthase/poly-beta-1,6-N-acetylglucosamine synthase-like glycosyltransferase